MLVALFGYNSTCIDGQFSKPFKACLEDAAHMFITNMIEESKYCSHVIKNHFNKELVMTKEDDESFESSTKCWLYDNTFVGPSPFPGIKIVFSHKIGKTFYM